MGSLTLQYPPMTGGSAEQQLTALRGYLMQLTDELNGADWSANAVLQELSQAIDAQSLPEAERQTKLSGWAATKSLIIKTADFAAKNSEQFRYQLSGSYVAKSDFGLFQEQMTLALEASEAAIQQNYEYFAEITTGLSEDITGLGDDVDTVTDYTRGVNNKLTVNSKQYIRTGLLYYDDVLPVYGVGVGNLETTVTENGEVLDRTKNELLTVTPGRVSFWQEGQEVAYLSQKKLYFPAGTLVAYEAQLSGTVTAAAGSSFGPWSISESSIYRTDNTFGGAGLYFGTGGLSIKDAFQVDANGTLTATGATVTGTIRASDLLLQDGSTYSSIKTQLRTLVDEVSELSALAGTVSVGTSGTASAFDFYVAGVGGLQITGASSAGYAVELSSQAALRLVGGTGTVYIQNSGNTGAVSVTADGNVSMKGSKFLWNGSEVTFGASTATAVFG